MITDEEQRVGDAARRAGLIAGAVHRGEVWPVGTLVRWAGRWAKVTYRIDQIRVTGQRLDADSGFDVHLTPVHGTRPGVGCCWADCASLRVVQD